MVSLGPRKFFFPSNIIRILELVCSLLALVLVVSWSSKGVTYSRLDKADVNIVKSIQFFIGTSSISLAIVIVVCSLILTDMKSLLIPIMDATMSCFLCLFWMTCSILLSVKLYSVAGSITVQEMDLNFQRIEIAVAFGFLNMAFHGGDVWFAAAGLRQKDESPIRHTHMSAHLYNNVVV